MTGRLPRGAWLAAAGLTTVLALAAPRYGFHRDELYFIAAGRHPAWGYPDQPAAVPLLATAWHDLVGGRLWAFRLLPALLTGGLVLAAAAISARLGGRPRDQVGTAVLTALTTVVLAVGHLFSTTTFDLVLSAALLLLILRALDAPAASRTRAWLVVGLTAGVALNVKTLPAVLLLSVAGGLLLVGPRQPFRLPGPWLAAGVAGLLAAPTLIWQAGHGWPQLEVGRAIAAGSSATSAERWAIVPLQVTLLGPVLAVVAGVGLVRLFRSPGLRPYRWLGGAYLVLLAFVVLTGGKPYYVAEFGPVLLATGVPPVLDRLERSRRLRIGAGVLLAIHTVIAAVICLPVATPGSAGFDLSNAVNPDAGETVGWDAVVTTVADAAAALPAGDRSATVVLTENYGEAGALDRARRRGTDLPPVYSGHNGFAEWGPPAADVRTVVLVGGYDAGRTASWFGWCRQVATLTTGVDNEEDDAPVRICRDPRQPWHELWPQIRRLG